MRTSRGGWMAVAAFLAWGVVSPAWATVKFVTPTGTGDGSEWALATSLTNALATVAEGGAIWLAEGTYTNSATFTSAVNNVVLYGGFTTGMTTLDERDWNAYPTILNGQGARRVMTLSTATTLDGLVISNGLNNAGAGLYANGAFAVTLRNCRIADCTATSNGARGVGAYMGSVTLFATNTTFTGNRFVSYESDGAGLYALSATVTLVDCVFTNNTGHATNSRSSRGGALCVSGGTLTATNCMFVDNKIGTSNGNYGGGAGWFGNGAVATFEGCTFRGNEVLYAAIGSGNDMGGGLWVEGATTRLVARHCVFDDNLARLRGGAIYVRNGTVELANCTLVNNQCAAAAGVGEGGAIYTVGGNTTVTNSIFYGNLANARGSDVSVGDGYATIAWCRLGGTGSTHAFDLLGGRLTLSNVMTNDPLFADVAARDYHLKSPSGRWDGSDWVTTDPFPHSPCIDAGNPSDPVGDETAPNGARINLGRYGGTAEASRSPIPAPVVATRAASTNVNIAILRGELIDNDTIANVTIYYGTSPTVTNTATAAPIYPPQQTGTVFEVRLTGLLYDTDYYFRAYATNAYGEDWADTTETFRTGVKPPGGPDGVIHVKPDAAGGETGDCWFNAYRSLAQAAASVTAGTNEIWVAGGTYDDATLTVGATCSIYGGFAGTETMRGDRNIAANPVVINGKGERRCVSITAGTVLLDGLIVTNGYQTTSGAGINASGTYDLTLRDVQVLGCRPNGAVNGVGAYFDGGSVTMSNCVFRDNTQPGNYNGTHNGFGFYANNATVTIVDSRFESNGRESYEVRSSMGGAFFQNGGTLAVTNTYFIGNAIGCDLYGGAGVVQNGATASFMNCVFRGNRVFYRSDRPSSFGGALYVAGATTSVTVENCTLSDNYGAKRGGAFYLASGSLTVKNCILWGNTCADFNPGTEGYDAVCAGGTLTMSYSNLSGSKDSSTYLYDATGGDLVKGVGLGSADPLFASATDVHLKSRDGRWDPALNAGAGGWTEDAVSSPCIDAGDPASAYDNEPEPNGGRINLGAYGNTWQASKNFVVAPVVTNRSPTVTYNFATLRGELVDVDATAEIRIYYGFSDDNWIGYIQPSPAIQQTGTVFAASVGDLLYSTDYVYRSFATNAAGFGWADNLMSFTTGSPPPGGPDTVIHVKAGAPGTQSGTTWFDACHTLAAAVAKVNGATNEIWVAAGSEIVPSTVTIATNVSIYGGFLGGADDGETDRSQRSIANETALNGNNERRIMRITGDTVLLDGLTFTNGLAMDLTSSPFYRGSGLYASGGGNLTLANCVFVRNGRYAQRSGGGAYFEGGTVSMSNCVFRGNADGPGGGMDSYGKLGGGFYGMNAAITAVDCLFEGNGQAGNAGRQSSGGAFFLNGGSFAATNCVFVNNKTGTMGGYGGGGGAFSGTSTSRFVNCVFRGNSSSYAVTDGAAEGGVFRIAGTSATTVTVQNCSLAFNTAGGTGGVAWVSGGTLVLTNSILWGNQTAQAGAAGTEIAAQTANSSVYAAYTCFTGTNGNYVVNVDGNATLSFGDGILTEDPLFASTTDLHLQSRTGRWDPSLETWVTTDLAYSPCIDAGDPASDWSNEPAPNGRRINMGAYGGTPYASKSRPPAGTMILLR